MAGRAATMAELERAVEEAVKAAALNVHAELREVAPVDTGFLRANFQLSTGTPAEGTVPIGTPPNVAAVAAYKLRDGSAFVTNNADYAPAVNARGKHAGFVEAAIDAALVRR